VRPPYHEHIIAQAGPGTDIWEVSKLPAPIPVAAFQSKAAQPHLPMAHSNDTKQTCSRRIYERKRCPSFAVCLSRLLTKSSAAVLICVMLALFHTAAAQATTAGAPYTCAMTNSRIAPGTMFNNCHLSPFSPARLHLRHPEVQPLPLGLTPPATRSSSGIIPLEANAVRPAVLKKQHPQPVLPGNLGPPLQHRDVTEDNNSDWMDLNRTDIVEHSECCHPTVSCGDMQVVDQQNNLRAATPQLLSFLSTVGPVHGSPRPMISTVVVPDIVLWTNSSPLLDAPRPIPACGNVGRDPVPSARIASNCAYAPPGSTHRFSGRATVHSSGQGSAHMCLLAHAHTDMPSKSVHPALWTALIHVLLTLLIVTGTFGDSTHVLPGDSTHVLPGTCMLRCRVAAHQRQPVRWPRQRHASLLNKHQLVAACCLICIGAIAVMHTAHAQSNSEAHDAMSHCPTSGPTSGSPTASCQPGQAPTELSCEQTLVA
jgi:hypothetical protein